jgi:hypothetical protein
MSKRLKSTQLVGVYNTSHPFGDKKTKNILLHILASDVGPRKKDCFYSTLGKIWVGNPRTG